MEMILASSSPRRKEILEKAGFKFFVAASCYDEKINDLIFSNEIVENCAVQKALDVQNKIKTGDLIISADTVVVLNNKILGKPKDYPEAFKMLNMLSDCKHFVATSVCLVKGEKILFKTEITYVTFRKLSEDDIKNYIERSKPFDKAGSYGIQDEGFDFVKKIDGDIDNVIGFPMKLFLKMLNSF